MNLKGELNYIRGIMRHLDTEEGRYHSLKCVEARICHLYQLIEEREMAIKSFIVMMETQLNLLNNLVGDRHE